MHKVTVLTNTKDIQKLGSLLVDEQSCLVMQLKNHTGMTIQEIAVELKLDEDTVKNILKNWAKFS